MRHFGQPVETGNYSRSVRGFGQDLESPWLQQLVVLHSGVAVQDARHGNSATIPMGIASLSIVFSAEDESQSGRSSFDLGPENHSTLVVRKQMSVGLQGDDEPLDALSPRLKSFAQAPSRLTNNGEFALSEATCWGGDFGTRGRFRDQLIQTSTLPWELLGLIEANASHRFALIPA
jgi:hypothetical protein